MGLLSCDLPPESTMRRSFRAAILLSCILFGPNSFANISFATVGSFHGTNGAQPYGNLLRYTNGLFYGTTVRGGDFDQGTIFTATTAGNIRILASFDGTNGAQPLVGLRRGTNDLMYGVTSAGGDFGLGTVFSIDADGVLTKLFSFDGTNGARPLSELLQGSNGIFYGAASLGGDFNFGTIFSLSETGIAKLASFSRTNGAQPAGSLARSADGTLYGTTAAGGALGYGTVFSLPISGVITPLWSFTGGTDGAGPQGGLIPGLDQNLYGTTAAGGTNQSVNGGSGTIFRVTSSGILTTIHSFAPGQGARPFGRLIQSGNGIFYGTTTSGGASGLGTVFSFVSTGAFTNLHSFVASEGISPYAGLSLGTNGDLFGVASAGGRDHLGTLFELSGLAPFIVEGPTNQTVGVGDTVSFTVVAAGSAPLTFQWLFNSNNISNTKVISGARTSTLIISPVSSANSGLYSVAVQNSQGQVTTLAARLNVVPVPTIRISSPKQGAIVKTDQVIVSGTSSGTAVVARVYYQANGSGWQLATTADNWAHWKANVPTVTGTNEVDAFAESVIGTYSTTNTVLFYSPPFIPLQGTFYGLFSDSNGFAVESAGFLTLSLNYKGAFSGRMQMAGARSSFRGQFDSDGDAAVTIRRSGQTPLSAFLHLDLQSTDSPVVGTITNESWAAELLANRAVFDARTNPAPWEGRYTFNLPGSGDASIAPGGDSFGAATVSAAGRIVAVISLPDNTRFTQTVPVATDGTWPFFASLYSGKGIIEGWMSFTNPPPSVLGGQANWHKPPARSAKYYPDGFTLSGPVSGGLYMPTNAASILDTLNPELVLAGGDLSETITNQITLDSSNRVQDDSGNRLNLSFSKANGTFSGSLIEPGTGRKVPFSGVMREDLGVGDGFFLGTNETGQAVLEKGP